MKSQRRESEILRNLVGPFTVVQIILSLSILSQAQNLQPTPDQAGYQPTIIIDVIAMDDEARVAVVTGFEKLSDPSEWTTVTASTDQRTSISLLPHTKVTDRSTR
jgi:hypothetical protein